MAGLWELPTVERPADAQSPTRLFEPRYAPPGSGGELIAGEELATIRHGITRHRIRASVREGDLSGPGSVEPPFAFHPLDRMDSLGLTGMTKKVLRRPEVRERLRDFCERA